MIKLDGTQNALILDATSVALTIKSGVNTTPWTWTFPPNPGTAGYVLTTDGAGNTYWAVGGGGSPGGPANSVQFNNGGVLGGSSGLSFDGTRTLSLGAASSTTGVMRFFNDTNPTSVSLTTRTDGLSWTMTLPGNPGTAGQVLQTDGAGATTWVSASGTAIPITNDTTTATAEYPLFASVTTGNLTQVYTASPDYTYTPAAGELTAPHTKSATGIGLNSNFIAASYTIPAGTNGISAGTLTFAAGATVTTPAGTNWVVV